MVEGLAAAFAGVSITIPAANTVDAATAVDQSRIFFNFSPRYSQAIGGSGHGCLPPWGFRDGFHPRVAAKKVGLTRATSACESANDREMELGMFAYAKMCSGLRIGM